jgi:uncharacterized membrane protein (DUF4010 family)
VRRVREEAGESGQESVIVLLASATVFGRLVAEVAVVSPFLLRSAWLPLVTAGAAMMLVALFVWERSSRRRPTEMKPPNPSELPTAVLFAITYSLVLLAARAARDYFGAGGLYAVAALSGLSDVDAITLSTANLVERAGGSHRGTAARGSRSGRIRCRGSRRRGLGARGRLTAPR